MAGEVVGLQRRLRSFIRFLGNAPWLASLQRLVQELSSALLIGYALLLILEMAWPGSVNPYVGLRGLTIVVLVAACLAILLGRPVRKSSQPSSSTGDAWGFLLAVLVAFGAAALVWGFTRGQGSRALVWGAMAGFATVLIAWESLPLGESVITKRPGERQDKSGGQRTGVNK